MGDATAFRWSDAWLLGAIFWARRAEERVTLAQIIGWGDAMNHAIFTPEELESGLARLSAAGLIVEQDKAFLPAGRAIDWSDELQSRSLGGVDTIRWLEKKLGATPYRPGFERTLDARYPGFTRQRYDAAVNGYELRAAQVLRDLGL
ncbi:MAG TPA: hypothetical protein VF824_15105 [Thermoanaerobaculia bacterium]|jgi:hypothetical protein